jgi:hypothetical protein
MNHHSERVDIKGNQNIVGDHNTINIQQVESSLRSAFFKPNLDSFIPPQFIPPPFINEITERIQNNRFLIIGGSANINKSALARCTAWNIRECLPQANGDRPEIREWNGESSTRNLEAGLQEIREPSIIILPELSPQHISYNPIQLQRVAKAGQHYIVASSNLSGDVWKLQPNESDLLWYEVLPGHYTPEYLTAVLRQCLMNEQNELPTSLANKDWKARKELVDGVSLDRVAEQLKTPDNIALFVSLLCHDPNPDRENVQQLIEQVQNEEVALRQWYYQLEPRQQLLAAVLSFFNGLFDDQFFAALDFLVTKTWRDRNPLLTAYDYHDLDALKSVFNFVRASTGERKIENHSLTSRQALIRLAWNTHRRYLLTMLPRLAEMAKGSVNYRSSNLELYGSEQKQEQIRAVVGETLSELGIISLDVVQSTLLQLAADNHPSVQLVAANAMAHWRLKGKDNHLFDTLEFWYSGARLAEQVDWLLGSVDIARGRSRPLYGRKRQHALNNEFQQKTNGLTYIQSTVALTVALAAAYDRPNELAPRLCDLFSMLAKDNHSLVVQRFVTYTLRLVMQQHWYQLRGSLEELVLQARLIPSIAVSLAGAYRSTPEKLLEQLDQWQDQCQKLPVQSLSGIPRWREAMLATIALTYGYIPYDLRIGPLTAEEGFLKLESILANDYEHSFVRIAVLRAISLKANERFDEIEPHLQHLVATIQPDEQSVIAEIITGLYLEQRRRLQNGEETITVNGRKYPVWLDGSRPLTAVEQAMYKWVEQAENVNAQRIALQAFVAFVKKFDRYEIDEIQQLQKERAQIIESTDSEPQRQSNEPYSSWHISASQAYLSVTVIFGLWMATLGKDESLKAIIRGLLPEAIKQHMDERQLFEFVLEKWRHQAGQDRIQEIAIHLKRAISWANNAPLIFIGLVIAAVLFLSFLSSM